METAHHPLPNPLPPHTLCTPFTYMPEDAHWHMCTYASVRVRRCARPLMEVVARAFTCGSAHASRSRMRARTGNGAAQQCAREPRAYVARGGWSGGWRWWVGSEINVFVLRPPSYAPGKDSVSRKGLMAKRMAETTELRCRVEYQAVIAFVCKGPSSPPLAVAVLCSLTPLSAPRTSACFVINRSGRCIKFSATIYSSLLALYLVRLSSGNHGTCMYRNL